MKVIHNLKPIYNENSKILILGSMPSVISRKSEFYYANKTNRFWKILEILFSVHLKSTKEKKTFLLQNKIALWDVIKSCDINGSSDSSIKNIEVNDISSILKKTNIVCIFCTGKKAYELLNKHFKLDIKVIYLPSPSSANASFTLEKLVSHYTVIKTYLK